MNGLNIFIIWCFSAWAQSTPDTYWAFLDLIMFIHENVADSEMKDLGNTIWMDIFIIRCFSTFSCERGWLAAGELKIYRSIKYLSYNTRACSKFIVVHCAFQVLNWGAWSYTRVSNIFSLLFQKTKLKLAGHVNPLGILIFKHLLFDKEKALVIKNCSYSSFLLIYAKKYWEIICGCLDIIIDIIISSWGTWLWEQISKGWHYTTRLKI